MTPALSIPAGTWGQSFPGAVYTGPGSGVGVAVGCDDSVPPNGNQSGGLRFNEIWCLNFDTGWQVGDAFGRAASELTFIGCKAEHGRIGIALDAYNTLNLTWINLQLSGCTVGLDTGRAGAVSVAGGSASGCRTVFRFPSSGVYTVGGCFRAEDCDLLAEIGVPGGTATSTVRLDNVQTSGRPRPGPDVIVRGGGGLHMTGGILEGWVRYEPANDRELGSVVLEGVRTRSPELLQAPNGARFRYDLRDCAQVDKDNVVVKWFKDKSGDLWPQDRVPPRN